MLALLCDLGQVAEARAPHPRALNKDDGPSLTDLLPAFNKITAVLKLVPGT